MSIQSVDRALDILKLFSATKTRLGISEMGKALGLTNSTVHGLVRTLAQQGFLRQDPETRKYSLGVSNLELYHFFLGGLKIYQVGSRATHRLAQQTGRTSRLGIWDQDSVVVIVNIFARPEAFQYYPSSPRIPGYCTAMGKSILASLSAKDLGAYLERHHLISYTAHTLTDRGLIMEDLEKTRLRGYAVDREESMAGIYCLAAPIFDEMRNPVAAVSISGGPDLLEDPHLTQLVQELIHTSREISQSMGFQPEVPTFTKTKGFDPEK